MRHYTVAEGMICLNTDFIQGTNKTQGSLSDESLTRAIVFIIAAISDRDVINQCPSDELRDCLALHFIDCLVQFLNLKGKYLTILHSSILLISPRNDPSYSCISLPQRHPPATSARASRWSKVGSDNSEFCLLNRKIFRGDVGCLHSQP
jgi:hypothetical protein